MRGKHARRVAARQSRSAARESNTVSHSATDARAGDQVGQEMSENNEHYRELCWTELEIKGAPSDDSRVVSYVASSDSIDSAGDIVEQDWNLGRFEKNPIILYNHNRATGGGWFGVGSLTPEQTLPIGRAVKWGVEQLSSGKRQLKIDVEFAPPELNAFADQVFRNVKAGFVKGGSVGFRPHSVKTEKVNDVEIYRLSQNELFEFSIVPMGANADAVTLSSEHAQQHRAYLKSLAEKSAKPSENPKETTMPEPVVETNVAEVPVAAGADVEKLKALEAESRELREKLAAREKVDAERDVDAIIGKSIVPAQRADFLELRMLNSGLFERITKALPDLKLAEPVVKPEPIEKSASTEDNETPGARAARKLAPETEK